jgi:hypothetical protein
MKANTRVNGTDQTDEVTIYCKDTIAVMNNDLIRQGLMAANDSSGYPQKPLDQRRERAFLLLQDSVTPGAEPYLFFFPLSPDASICSPGEPYLNLSNRPANTRVLGGGHTHVVEPGTQVDKCVDMFGVEHTGKARAGASNGDWGWVHAMNIPNLNPGTVLPLKEYIVKGTQIEVLDPSKNPGSELLSTGRVWQPLTGRCVWPKRSLYRPNP